MNEGSLGSAAAVDKVVSAIFGSTSENEQQTLARWMVEDGGTSWFLFPGGGLAKSVGRLGTWGRPYRYLVASSLGTGGLADWPNFAH